MPFYLDLMQKKSYFCQLLIKLTKLELLYDEKNRVLRAGRHLPDYGQLF